MRIDQQDMKMSSGKLRLKNDTYLQQLLWCKYDWLTDCVWITCLCCLHLLTASCYVCQIFLHQVSTFTHKHTFDPENEEKRSKKSRTEWTCEWKDSRKKRFYFESQFSLMEWGKSGTTIPSFAPNIYCCWPVEVTVTPGSMIQESDKRLGKFAIWLLIHVCMAPGFLIQ